MCGFLLYIRHCFLGESRQRGWTLACFATIATCIHLRFAPPLGHFIPLSLSNELCHVFHLVKQPDTAIISPSPSPSLIVIYHPNIIIPCTPTHHSLLFVLNVVVHYYFLLLQAFIYLSRLLRNTISFTLCQGLTSSHAQPTRFSETSHVHTHILPPSGLPQ